MNDVLRAAAFTTLSVLIAAPAASQSVADVQVFGLATWAADDFYGGGAGAGIRPGGRLRVAVAGAVGATGDAVAGRAEIMVTFHVHGLQRTGLSAYGGGGATVFLWRGTEAGYLLLLAGIEAASSRGAGWFLELGVGGGVRVAGGVRLRRVLRAR